MDFPSGAPKPADPQALWDMVHIWKKQMKRSLGVLRSTIKLERSEHSGDDFRVHLHWKIDLAEALDRRTAEVFDFNGVTPNVRPTWAPTAQHKARGANAEVASNCGHFYCWAWKKGSVFRESNWKPWQQYAVLGKWVDDLWSREKITNGTYGNYSLRLRKGYAGRKRDLDAVMAEERARRAAEQVQEVNQALALLKKPYRLFRAVTDWEDSFLQVAFRWKVLVLVADTASGKSSFAESLFQNPYIITVEDAEHLDLRGFDYESHDGLILDNVNRWAQLRKWRAVLQARNSVSKGGQSATNIYAYAQYLYGVPICATIDLDTPDKHLVQMHVPEEEAKGKGKGKSLVLNPNRSRWLLGNTVRVELVPGEKFWDTTGPPHPPPDNTFSLFAQNLRRRRRAEAGDGAAEDPGVAWMKGSPGPGGHDSSDEEGAKGRRGRKGGKEAPRGKEGKAAKGVPRKGGAKGRSW